MNYGEVLSKAWQIIWKHKVLWIFGILAGCSRGSSGSGNVNYAFSRGDMPRWFDNYSWQFNQMSNGQIAALVGVGILVILVLVVLAIFLNTIGRIGIIRGTQQADLGAISVTFGDLFRGSLPYFWRVFLLNLLVGLVIALIVLVFVSLGVVVGILTLGLALLCLIPLICLIVPLAWLVTIFLEQANIAIVVENVGIMDGLRRGWEVFTKNFGPMILMGLILYVGVGLIGGLIIAAPMLLIIIPAVGGLALGVERSIWGGLVIAGLCFIAYLPFLILLNGILTSYIESAWTLTYMRLTSKPDSLVPVSEPAAA